MGKMLKATHQGELSITEEIKIPCAVLENGERVLRERSVARSLGKKGGGAYWKRKKSTENGAVLPEYVSAKNLDPFIDDETRALLLKRTSYKTLSGSTAAGISADVLPKICDIWLKARQNGALSDRQLETADKAEILMRGFAVIGIIALVDEATGYQDVRAKDALAEILQQYLAKELQKWAKTFPDEFYREMFRLKGWEWRPWTVKKPSVIGKYTIDLVYERIAPGVRHELERLNPKQPKGHRKSRHHQWFNPEIGHPRLKEHISGVIALMRASANWNEFMRLANRAYPKPLSDLPLFQNIEDDE